MVSFIDSKVLLRAFFPEQTNLLWGLHGKISLSSYVWVALVGNDCIAACLSKASLSSVVRCGPTEVPVSIVAV